uniref:Deoxyribonuclease-1-like 1 n=1 Tax=Felis catus TaxID=9685 RepID=A0ABI7VST2_FELCA
MCQCWKASAGRKAGDLQCWQLREAGAGQQDERHFLCPPLPCPSRSRTEPSWDCTLGQPGLPRGPRRRTPSHALPGGAPASPARWGRGLSHLCLQCPAADAREGGQGTCDGHVGPGTFIPEGKLCPQPEAPALPDQGHFREKRGQRETWVWRCGARSFPVIGLSLLFCDMGAVWMGVALGVLPGPLWSQCSLWASAREPQHPWPQKCQFPRDHTFPLGSLALSGAGPPGVLQILVRCDIMVLQEVVDSSGSAMSLLLRELNRFDESGSYTLLSSPSLGRSTYMEKYVYVYRSHKTQVLDSYVYNDEDDLFAREPFVARFTFPSKVLPSLVLVPLHTSPKAVEKELNALYDVFLDVSKHWQSKDMILLGDFNADCASLTKKRIGELVLRTQEGFHWVIPDGEDTTVRASTHCAYDRIVLHGERCQSLLRSAAAFDFPGSFGLTEEEALNVSDHYPVEVELSRAARRVQPLGLAAALLLLLLLLP